MKRFFLFVLIVTLIFVSSACKKNEEMGFNIVGTWNFAMTFMENQQTITENFLAEFTPEGNWVIDIDDFSSLFGTYSVSGNVVQMQVTHANFEQGITGSFTGQFENENRISGDWTIYDDGSPSSGTWMAIRN
jgi:hypothetical protein